ncbi:MAG: rhomboid family intramembrane serine protease [Planctomycetota bacterium]
MIVYSTDAPIYHRPVGTILLISLSVLGFFYALSNPERSSPIQQPRQFDPGNRRAQNQDMEAPKWNEDDFALTDESAEKAPPTVTENDADELDTQPKKSLLSELPPLRLRLHPDTLNPLQWFTSPLVHDSPFALIINGIALWAFGMLVEGKVGTRVFLAIFFALAGGQAALLQVMMIASSAEYPISGASAGILGLMGLSVVWAPKNNVEVWFGFWIGSHDVPILMYGFIQFALSLIFGHIGAIFGLAFGLGLGFVWLRRKWVDCEGWDLVSVMKNEHDKPNRTQEEQDVEQEAQELVRDSLGNEHQKKEAAKKRARREAQVSTQDKQSSDSPSIATMTVGEAASTLMDRLANRPGKEPETPIEDLVLSAEQRLELVRENVEELILDGHHEAAIKMMKKLDHEGTPVQLSQPALAKLLRDLTAAKEFNRVIPWMLEHIERFDVQRTTLRLNLAKLHLHLEKPKKALHFLREIERASLNEIETANFRKLVGLAKKQIAEGVIEISEN